jgi:hypothetical protein
MTEQEKKLLETIEVYEVGCRRLYAKTNGPSFAIFEDELTPEELIAIAKDITARHAPFEEAATCPGLEAQKWIPIVD